jgi:tetratricopeptide (TPR) repeat protein
MPEKKNNSGSKTAEARMTNPSGPKTAKLQKPAVMPSATPAGIASIAQQSNAEAQFSSFEAGMKLFHTRNLTEARLLFEQAARGPERDVAERARLNVVMCDRRLQTGPAVTLGCAEDYYTYGVALINTRSLTEACVHLEKGVCLAPDADHIHYALALANALSGDLSGALEHLARAIELDPRNRLHARKDADLMPLAHQPPFHALLYPEKAHAERQFPEKKSW